MKKVELKKMGIGSIFKVTFYMMILPSVIFFLVGIVMSFIGIVVGQPGMIFFGVICGVLYPFMFLGLSGALYMLIGVIYNFFAQRFGGLEMFLDEKDISVPAPLRPEERVPMELLETTESQELQDVQEVDEISEE